jgi:PhnB protein
MSTVETYLFFDDNCAEAMQFYKETLGGELRLLKTSEAPPGQSPPGTENKIMHARLESGSNALMASDWLAPEPYPGKTGFYVSLTYATVDEARTIFDKLSAGGKVDLPLQETFWSKGFGMLVDRFGTPWMISVEQAS